MKLCNFVFFYLIIVFLDCSIKVCKFVFLFRVIYLMCLNVCNVSLFYIWFKWVILFVIIVKFGSFFMYIKLIE